MCRVLDGPGLTNRGATPPVALSLTRPHLWHAVRLPAHRLWDRSAWRGHDLRAGRCAMDRRAFLMAVARLAGPGLAMLTLDPSGSAGAGGFDDGLRDAFGPRFDQRPGPRHSRRPQPRGAGYTTGTRSPLTPVGSTTRRWRPASNGSLARTWGLGARVARWRSSILRSSMR